MGVHNQRKVYGETLVELGKKNPDVVVLEADLGKSTMSCMFEAEFPERYFEMGIAEQNMTSFAGGLALTGKIPFTNTFAVFASGRAYDQIRQSIGTAQLNVKIVGSSSGMSDFGDGATHQCIDDVAIMSVIPNALRRSGDQDGGGSSRGIGWPLLHPFVQERSGRHLSGKCGIQNRRACGAS